MNSALPRPLYKRSAYLPDERDADAVQASCSSVRSLLIGTSSAMDLVRHQIGLVADSDAPVLLSGPTGCGKEVAARAIHAASHRAAQPFVAINCGAIPAELIESELFGHEKGAFTGATERRIGRLEMAAGGTVLLDEIGDMPMAAQVRLLRVLEERSFQRVGGSRTVPLSARVVAASHCRLDQAVTDGQFRSDLYYRLAVVTIALPSLAERCGDIPALVDALTKDLPQAAKLSHHALGRLMAHSWPGNVRELRSVLVRAALFHPPDSGPVDANQMEQLINPAWTVTVDAPAGHNGDIRPLLEAVEQRRLHEALVAARGVVAVAARHTGLNRTTFLARMRRYGLTRAMTQSATPAQQEVAVP